MKYIASERKDQVRRQSEAAIQRVVDMYGTDDFFRIEEMRKSGELTAWLMGRFGTTNFTVIDQLFKSGKYGDQKEFGNDENQYNDLASSSDVKFCQETMTLGKKTVLRAARALPHLAMIPQQLLNKMAREPAFPPLIQLVRFLKMLVSQEMNQLRVVFSISALDEETAQRHAPE